MNNIYQIGKNLIDYYEMISSTVTIMPKTLEEAERWSADVAIFEQSADALIAYYNSVARDKEATSEMYARCDYEVRQRYLDIMYLNLIILEKQVGQVF